ncbi:MAG: HD domain-containing protein [Lachnospiraceae bacterium]|nr:HD domain-containing protein [Lachnospiraceae bacterium]
MIGLTHVLMAIAIVMLVITSIRLLFILYKNWDVTLHNRKKAVLRAVAEAVTVAVLVWLYIRVSMLWPANIWVSVALLVSSIVICIGVETSHIEYRKIKDRNMELLGTLICVMEAGDPNLDGHSLYVHNLSMVMYEYLPPLYKQQINEENLKYASLFLDMGKLGIPRDIISKPGKLTEEEMAVMRRHPEICTKILAPVCSFPIIADWILYHHERVDGKGYHGLKGNEIPLASRLMAIADTYSALTMDRTYKASMLHEDAIIELKQAAGAQLDEELVKIFCEIPKHRIEECLTKVTEITDRYKDEHFR